MTNATTIRVDRTGSCGGVTAAIVEAVATLDDREPTELDICLADYVDPDAVDALVSNTPPSTALSMRISFEQYDAVVQSNGLVTVTDRSGPTDDVTTEVYS